MNALDQLVLCMYWYRRPLTGGEFFAMVQSFLAKMQERFAEFHTFFVLLDGRRPAMQVAPDCSLFKEKLTQSLPKQWVYNNVDERNKSFSPTCTSRMGFSAAIRCATVDGSPTLVLEFSIGKAEDRSPNSVIVRFSEKQEDRAFLAEVIKACIEFWDPTHASVSRGRFDDQINQPINDVRVGWLTYLRNVAAEKFVPVEMDRQVLANGVLIFLSDSVPRPMDPSVKQQLQRLRRALEDQGFLRNPRDL